MQDQENKNNKLVKLKEFVNHLEILAIIVNFHHQISRKLNYRQKINKKKK